MKLISVVYDRLQQQTIKNWPPHPTTKSSLGPWGYCQQDSSSSQHNQQTSNGIFACPMLFMFMRMTEHAKSSSLFKLTSHTCATICRSLQMSRSFEILLPYKMQYIYLQAQRVCECLYSCMVENHLDRISPSPILYAR